MVEIAETEVGTLRDGLRQSFDRETGVRAQARKALKEMQEKLQEEIVAHQRTDEALNQRLVTQKEQQSGKS